MMSVPSRSSMIGVVEYAIGDRSGNGKQVFAWIIAVGGNRVIAP